MFEEPVIFRVEERPTKREATSMNPRWIHEHPVRRPSRAPCAERPAQLELTLELPRDPDAVRPAPSEEEVDEPERGIAVIDFYV
jgi:hypothetical protein